MTTKKNYIYVLWKQVLISCKSSNVVFYYVQIFVTGKTRQKYGSHKLTSNYIVIPGISKCVWLYPAVIQTTPLKKLRPLQWNSQLAPPSRITDSTALLLLHFLCFFKGSLSPPNDKAFRSYYIDPQMMWRESSC